MRQQLQGILVNRLRLILDRRFFPGIAREKVERPIFVVGFARSGSTLLHGLLAQDPESLTPLAWHTRMISPPPGAGPIAPGRIAYANRYVERWIDMCPGQLTMHPYADLGAYQTIEDEEIYTLDFRNAYPSLMYRVPTLDVRVVLDDDGRDTFRFHREVLQHLQWNTGKKYWVCKTGSAQGCLPGLFDVYPDALLVWSHRPVAEIYASNVAVRSVTFDAINGGGIDWSTQSRARAETMKLHLDKLMANAMIDDPRIMHIPFHALSKDPIGTIKAIQARRGAKVSAEYEGKMQTWLDDPSNRVDRYGRYPYSYDGLGFDKAWVRTLFADYSTRFELQEES
jgi:Sulfotransferase family